MTCSHPWVESWVGYGSSDNNNKSAWHGATYPHTTCRLRESQPCTHSLPSRKWRPDGSVRTRRLLLGHAAPLEDKRQEMSHSGSGHLWVELFTLISNPNLLSPGRFQPNTNWTPSGHTHTHKKKKQRKQQNKNNTQAPRSKQYCNLLDCTLGWVGGWSCVRERVSVWLRGRVRVWIWGWIILMVRVRTCVWGELG